jgi:hypothetical protein
VIRKLYVPRSGEEELAVRVMFATPPVPSVIEVLAASAYVAQPVVALFSASP